MQLPILLLISFFCYSIPFSNAGTTCTEAEGDPYSSGSFVPCCDGLTQLLGYFSSTTTKSYLCLTPQSPNGNPIWSEEFNTFDTASTWNAITGYLNVNGEIETYSSDPQYAFVQDGVMNLVAKKQSDGKWYSARYTTQGHQEFLYGWMETRVKMPPTNGAFPAVWMMGSDGQSWPNNGEMDITEYQSVWGYTPTTLHFPDHYGGNALSWHGSIVNYQDWHVYAFNWREGYIEAYQDGVLIGRYNKPTDSNNNNWPYGSESNKFYFLMNLAVQPSWGSAPDSDCTEMTFQIDYIKVYA